MDTGLSIEKRSPWSQLMYTIYYFCRVLIDPREDSFLGNAAGVSGVQVVEKTRLGLNLVIFKIYV